MTNRDKSADPAADTPGRPPGSGDTVQSRDDQPDPKLPHERDESSSHQGTEPRERIEQGRRDLEAGRVDTSKHEAMDAPYERQKERP